MFGILRTFLALVVVAGHLYGPWKMGTYAVFGFYALSGYLMTMTMAQNYGYSRAGILRFGANRVLRIYPAYWAAIIFSIVVLLVVGEERVVYYHSAIAFTRTGREIFNNLFLYFYPATERPRLSPATWALTVELGFYILIGLGVSKTRPRSIAWFALSVAYTVHLLAQGVGWNERYSPLFAASLPFSAGSLWYHCKAATGRLNPRLIKILLMIVPAAAVVNFSVNLKRGTESTYGFYLNLLLLMSLIALCRELENLSSDRMKRLDKAIGHLSYPIYLVHWQTGLVISFLIFGTPVHGQSREGLVTLLVSVPVVILVAHLMHRFVEEPIERIRNRLKKRKPNPAELEARPELGHG
jgi:peptidoglycan/LPS O-acetylase OafA/YrhL